MASLMKGANVTNTANILVLLNIPQPSICIRTTRNPYVLFLPIERLEVVVS
jgi:hypothetical protein